MSLFRKLVGIFQAAGVALRKRLLGGLPPVFVEDVFSTYLHTGNGSTQTITNDIDLSTKGGMVWIKQRNSAGGQRLTDTTRGATKSLASNSTAAEATETTGLTAFGTTGFTIGADADYNTSAATYVSWSLRKQQKFFDIVTYTGTGANRTIAHNLGSIPGCIIVKRTSAIGAWNVYHRSLGNAQNIELNSTGAAIGNATIWNSTTPTSTEFSLGPDTTANASGSTYVAYIFAHDAGGFGLTGTDNVISCGTITYSSGQSANLGWEPQFLLIKESVSTGDWYLVDTMRSFITDGNVAWLNPNLTIAESAIQQLGFSITSTGFQVTPTFGNGSTFIYIAIRRGPMRVPTSGASVFYSAAFGDTQTSFSTGFATDFAINKVTYYNPDQGTYQSGTNQITPRLTGLQGLQTNTTNAEGGTGVAGWDIQDGYKWANGSGYDIFGWAFKRAPSFADVVCYTGTGSNTTVTHNLGAVPELIFVKRRDTAAAGDTYCSALANTEYLVLNTTAAKATGATRWNSTTPTSSVFSVGTSTTTNASAGTYVAYLFSTCAGVSKVGGYTGTGSTQTIDCGFTSGARFILIKRTNTTGNWFVYDSSRGIQSGNDPYLILNDSTAAVINTDYVAADSTGFQVIGTGLNVNAATYIFLAIA